MPFGPNRGIPCAWAVSGTAARPSQPPERRMVELRLVRDFNRTREVGETILGLIASGVVSLY